MSKNKMKKKQKKYKKSIDQYWLRWYSNTCPWDKGETTWNKLKNLKKLLTKKTGFDKIKKLDLRTLKIKQ